MSTTPDGFSIERDLPTRFAAFYKPLHDAFTARQQQIIKDRKAALKASLEGKRPDYLPPSEANGEWHIELPAWCAEQRNQMTGPADDHELVVKMLNSGAPGVMIDLEDSMANVFSHTLKGIDNALQHTTAISRTWTRNAAATSWASTTADGALDARARFASLASRCVQRPDVGVAVRSGAARV